jgi:phosphatidylglycerol---prolipoprotein diacylglyceryl transferase
MRPVLFDIFGLSVPSYGFFLLFGFLAGGLIYFLEARRKGLLQENFLFVALAAFFGAALGAKIPIWVYYYKEIFSDFNIYLFFSGRTIVGGIIGGWIAVELVKRKLMIRQKTGDLFAPGIALGTAMGRIGCLLKGCCHGVATTLPWGYDFGDGLLRHPTQMYSIIFNIALFIFLWLRRKKIKREGELFELYLIIYFSFRFLIEFIRTSDEILLGLSGFQLAAIFVIAYTIYMRVRIKRNIKN